MNRATFLASVKRRAFIPDAGAEYSDDEILDMAQEGLTEKILPTYQAIRDGYLQTDVALPVGQNTTGAFQVPGRALGGAVLMCRYRDPSGNLYPLTRIDDSQRVWTAQLSAPVSPATAWYFVGDQIILQPPPPSGAGGNVIVTYIVSPNRFAHDDEVTQTQVIQTWSNTLGRATIAIDPSTVGWVTDTKVDIIAQDGSHGFRTFDATITAFSGGGHTITIGGIANGALGIQAGDYVCSVGLTPFPMVPDALHSLLALETARRFLDGIGDPKSADVNAELEERAPKVLEMLSPRGKNQPKRAINRYSAMRLMRSRGWWYGWQPGTY